MSNPLSKLTYPSEVAERLGLWLSTEKMAGRLGVHPKTLLRYVSMGLVPAHRVTENGPLLFEAAEVREALDALEALRSRRCTPEPVGA